MEQANQLYQEALRDDNDDDSDMKIPSPQDWLKNINVAMSWFNYTEDIENMNEIMRRTFTENSFYTYMDYMFHFVSKKKGMRFTR